MPTLTPEHSSFDPRRDYEATLGSFDLAFAAASADHNIFDVGNGIHLIAGNLALPGNLSQETGAETLHLVVVRVEGDRKTYRYQVKHFDQKGLQLGDRRDGLFTANFGNTELEHHTKEEGERVRGWLAGTQFDMFEAMASVHEQVSTPQVEAVLTAEEENVRKAKSARRWARFWRAVESLGALLPWDPGTNKTDS